MLVSVTIYDNEIVFRRIGGNWEATRSYRNTQRNILRLEKLFLRNNWLCKAVRYTGFSFAGNYAAVKYVWMPRPLYVIKYED
jgi:hypothetical protein